MQTVTQPKALEKPMAANVAPPSRKRSASAVTNGSKAFIQGDGNSPWYRRFKDLLALHVDDLGGEPALSEAQMSLCRRAATLEVELERIEGQLSLGNAADLDAYNRHAGGLRRILESLGIERRKRDITPDFKAYVAAKTKGAQA
ncbi:conserved hypothetical protein [Methylocella silvestris BL2]|uniref:Terminase n=1 Tax=Methylocella silvestris (strain DSM 15510 / CIP 108128 / LMG 27833 / NCIMB 13906 / BL2) TaxID=395965 RepID=B8EKX3_METSB|nr:conserved hypothetical protein [Methylocella silvestris BL2]